MEESERAHKLLPEERARRHGHFQHGCHVISPDLRKADRMITACISASSTRPRPTHAGRNIQRTMRWRWDDRLREEEVATCSREPVMKRVQLTNQIHVQLEIGAQSSQSKVRNSEARQSQNHDRGQLQTCATARTAMCSGTCAPQGTHQLQHKH